MTQWIVTSCVLILAVLGLRLVLKGRISLRLQYALWLLVAVRLLVPITFGESNLSAANLSQNAQPMVQQMEAVEIPVQSFDSAYQEVVQEHIDLGQDISGFENTEQLEYEAYERMEKVSLSEILTTVWIAGMVLSLAALLFSNLHFYFKLRKARRPIILPDTKLPVYCAPQIVTPCLFGLFRPAIYLTEDVLSDPQALNHVLAHESAHHRHGDHIWSILRGLCLCIHWYNPLVWTAAQVSRRDAELACDEAAIASLGEENRLDYGRTLIGLTCVKGVSPLLTATTMTGSKHSIKERITLIAKKPKFSVIALIALILAMTIAAGCSFTGPAAEPLDYTVYAFPGTEWGMTPDELMDSLDLTEEDITREYEEEAHPNSMYIRKEYDDIFGFPATAIFSFTKIEYGDAIYYFLDQTAIQYPDDTDMQLVKENIIKQYGDPTLDDAPPMFSILTDATTTEGHASLWASEIRSDIYFDQATTDFLVGSNLSFGSLTFNENWEEEARERVEKYKAYPAGTIWWTDDYNWLMIGRPGKEPGAKGVIFRSWGIEEFRAMSRTGLIYPIELPENPYLLGIATPSWTQLRSVIFQQQVGAKVPIVDAELNVDKMSKDVRSEEMGAEIMVYRVSYRLKPKDPDKALLLNELKWNGRWLESADPEYYVLFHQKPITDTDGNITTEEKWTIFSELNEAQLKVRYGTDEMIEKYGDMYTAAAMEYGNGGFEIYYS